MDGLDCDTYSIDRKRYQCSIQCLLPLQDVERFRRRCVYLHFVLNGDE